MKEINSLDDISVDWLKKNNYDAYFFGLGFIQVKIDETNRFHFYHPDLPAFVENPHNHRYNFVSKVLRGSLLNEVWEEGSRVSNTEEVIDTWIEFASCQKDGAIIPTPSPYPTYVDKAGEFAVNAVSSYYINKDSFHIVRPDFSKGPCVTWLNRGTADKEFAKVLKLPGRLEECPFSQELSDERLWEVVEDCLRR